MRKVIVNHNGQCGEHRYEAGVPVELPEEVIAALGDNATPLEQRADEKKEEPKVEKQELEEKEVQDQDVEDKMIKKAEVLTK
ncbi:MAG TPA: hypothetical protein VNW29_03335 [Candidatus Sulfotelmatobacter sp.]|jgi:hypothetical protein|nr:hypothetical protein [Candidatus Sulfotelmatobacter sp.]